MRGYKYQKYKNSSYIEEDSLSIPTFNNWNIGNGIYINDKKFVDLILKKAKSIDAVAYSATSDFVDILPINKLLITQSYGKIDSNVDVRYTKNIHTKLYLVTKKDNSVHVYVSSMNLVWPGSWHNLTVRMYGERAQSLKVYFKKLWSLASN